VNLIRIIFYHSVYPSEYTSSFSVVNANILILSRAIIIVYFEHRSNIPGLRAKGVLVLVQVMKNTKFGPLMNQAVKDSIKIEYILKLLSNLNLNIQHRSLKKTCVHYYVFSHEALLRPSLCFFCYESTEFGNVSFRSRPVVGFKIISFFVHEENR